MEKVKRVEIVIPAVALKPLVKLFAREAVSGYTIIEQVQGKGNRGLMDGDGLHNAFKNSLVIWACQEEELQRLVEPVRALIKEHGGVCLVSDALWLIH